MQELLSGPEYDELILRLSGLHIEDLINAVHKGFENHPDVTYTDNLKDGATFKFKNNDDYFKVTIRTATQKCEHEDGTGECTDQSCPRF